MKRLSDEQLFEAYCKAHHLKLSDEFIYLIELELQRRSLTVNKKVTISS